ncbi:uncharacterized protein [Temnothorax nylanderi]|uniref:uncharacterized protein isoform X1 n=2 Tax=Temnothorax nylanderi TaxID=102681 RepID=UPI003A8BD86A
MSFPYAVVQFPKEGTYSEIPTSWLTKDCTQCRWPTTKNATFFIKKNSPPEADWLLFDVKVECYCETLEKARKKAEDSNYATSCDEIRGRGKRIVHEKHFHDTYDASDDNTDDDSDLPPQLSKTPHEKLKINKNRDSSGKESLCDKQFSHEKQSSYEKVSPTAAKENFTPNRSLSGKSQRQIVDPLKKVHAPHKKLKIDKNRDSSGKESLCDKQFSNKKQSSYEKVSPTAAKENFTPNRSLSRKSQRQIVDPPQDSLQLDDSNESDSNEVEPEQINKKKKLVNICVETLEYVRSIDKRLNALERGNINVENEPIFDDILPINSIQNLKKFEESMETAETRSNFVEFMKKIGGKSTKNIVQRCMSRLFTNNFGIACSWYGRRNNYRMCDLKCICILKSVLRAKGIDECDFETTASEWFRLSKLRYGRENKKILPDDEPDAHNTVET